MLSQEAVLFDVKDAYWYSQRREGVNHGDNKYYAENPPYGAVFTYYMSDKIASLEESRKEQEKELNESNSSIAFPGWEALDKEKTYPDPMILFTIRNENGEVINRVKGKNEKGFSRVNWNLSYADRRGIKLSDSEGEDSFFARGSKATPGTYTVTMSKVVDGVVTELSNPKEFEVVPLEKGALEGAPYAEIETFRDVVHQFQQDYTATSSVLENHQQKVKAMQKAFVSASQPTEQLMKDIFEAKMALQKIDEAMNGSPAKNEIGERNDPTPGDGLRMAYVSLNTTYGPTENHKAALQRAREQLQEVKVSLKEVSTQMMPQLEEALRKAGAPWVEGQGLISE
jgi:hypothetical protein